MKQLSRFEKMRLNKQRREEVKKRRIQSEIATEAFRIEMEILKEIQSGREEAIAALMRYDPNASPHVDKERRFNWWPF